MKTQENVRYVARHGKPFPPQDNQHPLLPPPRTARDRNRHPTPPPPPPPPSSSTPTSTPPPLHLMRQSRSHIIDILPRPRGRPTPPRRFPLQPAPSSTAVNPIRPPLLALAKARRSGRPRWRRRVDGVRANGGVERVCRGVLRRRGDLAVQVRRETGLLAARWAVLVREEGEGFWQGEGG